MVHNHFIKCQVCGAVTRIRLQLGYLLEHPINVACGHCGIAMNGIVKIGQNTLNLEYSFENADLTQEDSADYLIECSGEFPTLKLRNDGPYERETLSPFMRFVSQEGYPQFKSTILKLNSFHDSWPNYKRILDLFKRDDRKFLVNEIWKILPKNEFQCRNEFEIARAVHMIEVIYLINIFRNDIIADLSLSNGVLQLPHTQVNSLIDFLNTRPGYSIKDLQSSIYKIYDDFIKIYPYLIPAIFLEYCDNDVLDFKLLGTTTSSFDTIKQFSLDTYETLGNLLVVPVALNNIMYRNDYSKCSSTGDYSIPLSEYINFKSKGKKYQYCINTELYTKELQVIYNAKLRNAIGHNDVQYDSASQMITYTSNPGDRSKHESIYLLEFESEVIQLFKAIVVISEYLYRLSEFELIKNGHTPIQIKPITKVGRNELCPCGSGLKYKKCHGI